MFSDIRSPETVHGAFDDTPRAVPVGDAVGVDQTFARLALADQAKGVSSGGETYPSPCSDTPISLITTRPGIGQGQGDLAADAAARAR